MTTTSCLKSEREGIFCDLFMRVSLNLAQRLNTGGAKAHLHVMDFIFHAHNLRATTFHTLNTYSQGMYLVVYMYTFCVCQHRRVKTRSNPKYMIIHLKATHAELGNHE